MIKNSTLSLTLCLTLTLVSLACAKDLVTQIKLSDFAKSSINVQTKVIKPQLEPNYINAVGKIESIPSHQFYVHSTANGHISKLFVTLGQEVSPDQKLLEYESPDIDELSSTLILTKQSFEAQISQLKASFQDEIKEAKTQVELANENYKRDQVLFAEKIGSQKNMQTSKAYLDISESKLKAAIAKMDLTINSLKRKLQLSIEPIVQKLLLLGASQKTIDNIIKTSEPITKLDVFSPSYGDIISLNATVGQSINPGVRLFTICNENSVWASANINERDIGKVAIGDKVEVNVSSYPNEVFTGKIVYMNHDLDPQSRTLSIRAEIQNHEHKLKPEMFTQIKIIVSKPHYAIIVPSDAIVENHGTYYAVLSVDNGNSYKCVQVEIDRYINDAVIIKNGLKSDEEIVTGGAFQILAQALKQSGHSELFKQPTEGDREYDQSTVSQNNNWLEKIVSILIYPFFIITGIIIGLLISQKSSFRKSDSAIIGDNSKTIDNKSKDNLNK